MKDLFKKFGIVILTLFVIAAALSFSSVGQEEFDNVGISALSQQIQQEKVENIKIEGDTITATLKDESKKKLKAKKEQGESFSQIMQNYGVKSEALSKVDVEVVDESGFVFWLRELGPYLFPILIFGVIIYFMSKQVRGMNNKAMGFGKSQAKEAEKDGDKKNFDDVAGIDEAKGELEEVVDFLKRPKQYSEMGAKIPKGVLLMGAPGTGKTLLARAIAGEAEVPFFHMSGSEFVEMFVGVGASRVRDLFEKAKKKAPAIIFIDEIDAVGRKRGAGMGGSHDEREQTLNQILVEMDGFDPHIGVIVIAATNRPDVLDKALLRPGRFDRQIAIDMPDIKGREEILRIHSDDKPLADSVDLRQVAERTPGFTGADLENLLNESAILAVRKGEKKITNEMIFESIERVMMGPEKRSKVMTDKEREITAYHESGHAIVGNFLEHCDPVRKVSIIGRGRAGGYTLAVPEEEVKYKTIAQLKDKLAMIMGGYVTEKKKFGNENLSTGPSSDLDKATDIATKMVKNYGMSESLAPRKYGENEDTVFLAQDVQEDQKYSEDVAKEIDREINNLLLEARDRARKIMDKHENKLESLVEALLKKETIERDDFAKLMEGEEISFDDSSDNSNDPDKNDEKKKENNSSDSDDNKKD